MSSFTHRSRIIVSATLVALVVVSAISTLFLHLLPVNAAPRSSDYIWKPLKIGGGGFVTGLVIDPKHAEKRYARTDVGGAYQWDEQAQSWVQLLVASHVADPTTSDYTVESVAPSISDPSELFIAAGSDTYNPVSAPLGRILKSTDGGQHFAALPQHFWMDGNGDSRQGSERLVVDPANAHILFFGTRKQGLWTSADAGATWTQIPTTAIPVSSDNIGVQFVKFDPTGTTVKGKTQRIYASVSGQGIYRSDDAGASWRSINTTSAFTATIASDQKLYAGFGTSVQKYAPATNTWTTISPNTTDGAWQLAVAPNDPNFIFVAPGGLSSGHLFRSHDGGATWAAMTMAVSPNTIPWVAATDEGNYFSTATLQFDPADPTTLLLAQGTGMWKATGLTGSGVTWLNISQGIEEMDTSDVIAPVGGVPVTAVFDRQGFYHANVDSYPTKTLIDQAFWGGTSLDYRGGDPRFLVTVEAKNNEGYPVAHGRGAYSVDGGRSWTLFNKLPLDTVGGNVAVSATDPNNIVWLPSTGEFGQGKTPYYTVDRGNSWGRSNDITSVKTHWFLYWGSKRALESDKVLGATFYLETFDNNGTFYVSHDGGEHFALASNSPPCAQDDDCHVYGQLHAVPGHAGNIWSSAGKQGLWYSLDGGATAWKQAPHVQEARSFGFGAALHGTSYPAIYLDGKANGDANYGIYRSSDKGATWQKLSDAPAGIYNLVDTVTGDMNYPGRVYVGFSGNGYLYGDDEHIEHDHAHRAVKPVLECVSKNSATSYTAYFGTQNDNASAVTIPVGANNHFSPDPADRGQLVTFAAGRQQRSFAVPFDGSNLVWTLKGPDGQARTATASGTSQSCDFTPPPAPTPLPSPTALLTPPPAATPMTVYDDAVGDGWFSFSYSATDSLTNTAPVHSGQASISLTVTGAYGAVVFGRWKPPVDATTYTGISFWINGGTTDGTRALRVFTTPNSDGSGTQSTVVNVDAPANTWTHIVIPMSALGNPANIGQITISDRLGQAQPTLYLDDITLSNS